MPIQLDTMTVTSAGDTTAMSAGSIKTYTPKFFDSTVMTGVGKQSGTLNAGRNPCNVTKDVTTNNENVNTYKKSYSNGSTTVNMLPLNVLNNKSWNIMYMHEKELSELTKIAEMKGANGNITESIYIDMTVHSTILESTASTDPALKTTRKLTTCYQLFLYTCKDSTINKAGNTQTNLRWTCSHIVPKNNRINSKLTYEFDMTCNPTQYIAHKITDWSTRGYTIDAMAIDDYMNNFSLYDAVAEMSEIWQTKIHHYIEEYAANIENYFPKDSTAKNTFSDQLHQLTDYNIPLDLYKEIYKSIQVHFSTDDATVLCKQNLNLLLSDTISHIDQNKSNFTTLPGQGTINISKFSPEQQTALTTNEPLVLVQAGAGTGKSTVILGRIDYMISAGVKPEDITVLSFTNAAADNISNRNPDIHSMTIANMIHQIYSLNYPNHELSTIDTIINALNIYYPANHSMQNIALRFQKHLVNIKKNNNESFTNMNNFAEKNYDDIITMLDTIQQTCLEMEIILCYQKIMTLQEPPEIQSKYLIIDEVQDNSIFEFIYVMRYIDKHSESLFIVGDCSQTLYEFRASNPKALNVLEGSGVFKTYKLQVNYRSNQEILDFANIALANIEANQYANIQLQANSRIPVTEKSFTDAVHFYYHQLSKMADFNDALPSMFSLDLKKYMDDCIARNEQIAFLAHSRKDCSKMQDILEHMYPNLITVSLIPAKMYNDTIFSEFISRYWNEIKLAPTVNIISVIIQEIYAKAPYFVPGDIQKKMPGIQKRCGAWRQEIDNYVNAWYAQYVGGILTQDQFLLNIRDHMMGYEIRTNSIKQSLLASRNKENKLNADNVNANFLISTIHSAKGLEFDNVVILYKNDQILPEDKKRMYYVAFTRGMKSEFILVYDTCSNPTIQGNYEMLVKAYHEKDQQLLLIAANGQPVVTAMDEDAERIEAMYAAQLAASIANAEEQNNIANTDTDAITTQVDDDDNY